MKHSKSVKEDLYWDYLYELENESLVYSRMFNTCHDGEIPEKFFWAAELHTDWSLVRRLGLRKLFPLESSLTVGFLSLSRGELFFLSDVLMYAFCFGEILPRDQFA